MSADITAPLIQLDSVAIGFQLDDENEAKNINNLNLTNDEFLVVGEKTYIPGDTSNVKWNLIVNTQGTAVNASRNLARNNLTHDTSLYVDKNIYCSGIIKAAGLELSNIRIDNTNPITCNLIKEFIVKTNDLVVSQPFQTGYITNYSNPYNINYDVKNIFTPNYVTFGGHVDTFKNTHPLNIVSTPNNNFNSMHISIRNDTNNSEEPVKMCMGIIGGSNISPAIISTTKGVPLEFHVSRSSADINMAYGTKSFPIYNTTNIPAMTIDANNNVGIGTNYTSFKIYNKKNFTNNSTNNIELNEKSKLEVKGLSTFDDILLYDYQTKTYKHLDDIYIRGMGLGSLNATQINGGDFTDSLYRFTNNLSILKLLNTNNINIDNNAIIGCNLTTKFLNVSNHSIFDGSVSFNNNVDFDNVENININKLNITNDLFINNIRVTPLNTTDTFTGNFEKSLVDGSNYIFVYISSNIASLDANRNVNFPNKLGLGLTSSDGFDGILNITKNDRTTGNNFDILLKNTLDNKNYIANIGRLSRLDYNDNSLIFNTNKVTGKKNNIYFYPSTDISILTSNRYLPNLQNTPPTLSLLEGKVGINKLIPDNMFSLDINGIVAANDYYVSQNNNFKRTKNFIYNNDKNFFNLYDSTTDKFCINYNELLSFASDMRGLNVKKGINADLYYQNNILLETLQQTSTPDSFYTNKNISIGWNGEENVTPLQIRNLFTNDYNYSTIRIYRGVRGGGLFNNADYSGIDICEYDRDINQDRNNEKWFIYKNHKYNYMRVGPLQIGYTNKTVEPTSYGMSFYYDTETSKYHIDVNKPEISYDDKSAMTIYGDLNVHGNINILDNDGCNFNFTMKALSSNLQRVNRYINYISSSSDIDNGYSQSDNKIAMYFDILRPTENIIIDAIENEKIPVIIKNMNDDNPVTKFITYSKSNICYSMIELAIYNSNLQLIDDSQDKVNNIKNSIQISVGNNNSNTSLDFNVYNNNAYKNFLRFMNKVSNNGDANSTIAHLGLGTDKSSNILLHIDGNEKYGLQITNNKYPASINLLNSEGKNVYHTISGGDFHNNHKFTIDVSSSLPNNTINEPILTNVFTIDAFKYNEDKRRGARFGFNENFLTDNNQTFVIKSDYDTVPMAITSRYSYEYMFNSVVKIDYNNVSIDLLSSNWNNNNKKYFSLYKQNISTLPAVDDNLNPIISNNIKDEEFIFKTSNTISKNLSYISVHSNINYPYFFSNLNINYLSFNQNFNITPDSVKDEFKLTRDNNFNIIPKQIFYSSNDDIRPSDIIEKSFVIYNNSVITIEDNSNILFDYTYTNKYNIASTVSCNITITNYSNLETIDNSNYFNISNYITTTLSTGTNPFNDNNPKFEHIYTDFKQSKININEKYIQYSNSYLNTYTTNVLKYNSNISYDGIFYSIHSNYLNITTSNIIFDNLFDKNTAYLNITSNIIDANNIIFKTSNYSINTNANSTPRTMKFELLSSNIIIDTFDILGNTINKNLIIEEYFNDYSNHNLSNISIGIRNYNYTNYKPHISLINDVERNNSIFEGHEIYSYDGIFEIKYANSDNNQFVPLKIDSDGNMFINGGLDIKGNLRIDGRIYDANGNDLIEILNNYIFELVYKYFHLEYEINSSNIHFNSLGSNGLEINAYSSGNHEDYKFFYVKDYLTPNIINDILVLHKSDLLNNKYNLDLYTDLYVSCNLYIEGHGNNTSLSVLQKRNTNIIEASNLDREVLTLAYDGSMGLGVTQPQGVLLNIKQNIFGSNVISASNLNREVLTLAYDGSMGLGVTQPQGVLFNIKQNIFGSNVISASNLNREVLTLAYDGSMGLGVTQPQGVLLNIKQNISGSNVISASNLNRELLTLAYDGSMGLGVTQPQGVLLNIKQNIVNSNVISASNLNSELLTLAYDGSMGLGVTQPQGVLLNIKQNIVNSNVISASNLNREVLTLAYDGSMGLGVTQPQGVLLNIKQNISGSNVISASNLNREILTLAYDGSMGLGVTQPQGVLLNIKQNISGSNVISASNLNRELLTLAYDGCMGLGVTQPQGVLLNIKQNIVNSNVISASNLNREVLTLAYDGSMGLGVTQPQGVLLNIKQNIVNSNVISASNLNRELLTLAYDGSMGLGVTQPRGVLLNIKQNISGSNVISASNLNREILTLAYDGSMGLGVTQPQGVLLNIKQNISASNVISASNLNRELLTLAYDGSMGLGVTQPQGVLLNIKQNISGSNVISASNLNSELLTLAYDGSMGLGVTQPQGVLLNIKQNISGSNVISASNLNSELLTLAYDGSMGLGVTQPQGVLLNIKQNISGSNVISASNLNRELLTLAYDGSVGLGVTQPQGVLLNIKQNISGSNVISASNLNRELLTLAYDGSVGLGVTQPQGVLLNIKQNISGSNIISASNLNRELLTLAYDGSMGLGVTQTQGVLFNIKQNISGSNVISASNLNRELLTLAYDGSMGLGVTQPQGVLFNIKQNISGSNVISASNLNREVLTLAYDGSMGLGVTQPQGVLLNIKQNISGSNIISASNLNCELLTLAYDGSMGLGVTQPQGVLFNIKQNISSSNVISASNINRELLTLAYDGSMGLGVTQPHGILLNVRQNNVNSNIISASNMTNEVMTLTYDGVMGLGVTNPNKQSKLDVRGNINIVCDADTDYIYTINNRDIIKDTCNYVLSTSNIISSRITNLTTDLITENTNSINKFIVNNKYNNNLFIDGDLTINSNIIVLGTTTTLNTDVYTTEQLIVTNSGDGDAMIVKQINNLYNIFTASNNNIPVFNINYNGKVGIGTQSPKVFLEINSTDGIKIPSGSDIERPMVGDLVKGIIRYNTDTNQFEGYGAGNNWGTLGGVKDVNNDTYISAESSPGTNNDELRFYTSNIEKMIIKKDGKVGIGTQSPKVFLEINSTDGIKIPSGSDIERPTCGDLVKGIIRYNTDTNQFEGYGAGNNWGTLGGVKDVNNDTYISAESSPGTNNDELRFYTSNIEKMIIKKDGKVGIGNDNPEYLLDVYGDIRTNSNLFVNLNVGIGTNNISSSLLNIYGKSANIKIQDPNINYPVSSIEFINGVNNSIESNISYGWKIANSNNNLIIASGKNNIINNRLIIDGESGNIGIGTNPHIIMDNNGDTYKININGSINIDGDIYKQGVLFSQGSRGGTGSSGSVGAISQNMPVQTLSKTYTNTKSYLDTSTDNDNGWRFIDDNVNTGFLIKIKPSHITSKILLNLSMHVGIDSSPQSIWWGLRLYRKVVDNNQNVFSDWQEVIASRPENNSDNATPCWISHTLGANLTSYENFVANINGTFFDTPDSRYTVYYTVKWKTNLGNYYGGNANIYLNRPAKYNSSNSSVLSSTWTATEIWQLGTPYIPSEGSNIITIYNQDFVGIGNTQPQNSLDVVGDINITGTYKVNNEIFKTSQWTTNTDNNIYYNNFIGVGTAKPTSLLSLNGANARIKIQDDGIQNDGSIRPQLSTSIDLINGTSNAFEYNFNKCGWRMSNNNNNYIISSGSNSIIRDRFIIDGSTGNIGIGTTPNHKLDIDGIINAKSFNLNGSPFVLEFTQGMTVQTIHKTYSKTVEKQINSTGWIPIDDGIDGFYVKIKPSHTQSKVLVSMTCHIGMDYENDSRWWGLQLYRKIGDNGNWTALNNANGTNSGGLECSPCWISHNLGADNSMYSHSIINVSGSYEDEPNTEENVYYTAYWKSKLDNTIGKLYINRPAYINNSNYPLTSSSWTASEIWNNGTPYKPTTTTIAIAYDKVGIGMTPSQSSEYKLEVNGDVKCSNLQCISVSQTSDLRFKKNIENIDNILENINKLNPVSYLRLEQNITHKKSYGFIAQEIYDIFPDIVNEPKNGDELYSINYTSIIPLLTKSIQELTKKIDLQQEEINYLKQKL